MFIIIIIIIIFWCLDKCFFYNVLEKMTFGYWFNPCGARLATAWNKMEI